MNELINLNITHKPVVAFVCVHNSCRSQIAEALGKQFGAEAFISCSAGTQLKSGINPDAVRHMKRIYAIDIEEEQRPKLLAELPPVDVVITMGCGVECPSLPCKYREDWGLPDPTGNGDAAFEEVIAKIHNNVMDLTRRLRK